MIREAGLNTADLGFALPREARLFRGLGGDGLGRHEQAVDLRGEGLVEEVARDEVREELELVAQVCLEVFDAFAPVLVVEPGDFDALVRFLGAGDVRRDRATGFGGGLVHHGDRGLLVLERDRPGVVEEEGGAHR